MKHISKKLNECNGTVVNDNSFINLKLLRIKENIFFTIILKIDILFSGFMLKFLKNIFNLSKLFKSEIQIVFIYWLILSTISFTIFIFCEMNTVAKTYLFFGFCRIGIVSFMLIMFLLIIQNQILNYHQNTMIIMFNTNLLNIGFISFYCLNIFLSYKFMLIAFKKNEINIQNEYMKKINNLPPLVV